MENATPPVTPPPSQPPPSPLPSNPNMERSWCMWCHLSALSGFVIPLGNIIGPLIIWQMKRSEFAALDEHGKEAVNFQLSILIYLLGGGVLVTIGMFFCIGWMLLPLLIILPIAAAIPPIIAGVKANEGILYRYPLTLRLIK